MSGQERHEGGGEWPLLGEADSGFTTEGGEEHRGSASQHSRRQPAASWRGGGSRKRPERRRFPLCLLRVLRGEHPQRPPSRDRPTSPRITHPWMTPRHRPFWKRQRTDHLPAACRPHHRARRRATARRCRTPTASAPPESDAADPRAPATSSDLGVRRTPRRAPRSAAWAGTRRAHRPPRARGRAAASPRGSSSTSGPSKSLSGRSARMLAQTRAVFQRTTSGGWPLASGTNTACP